jgi:hypothetical protein
MAHPHGAQHRRRPTPTSQPSDGELHDTVNPMGRIRPRRRDRHLRDSRFDFGFQVPDRLHRYPEDLRETLCLWAPVAVVGCERVGRELVAHTSCFRCSRQKLADLRWPIHTGDARPGRRKRGARNVRAYERNSNGTADFRPGRLPSLRSLRCPVRSPLGLWQAPPARRTPRA